jgi:hypothetical protein
MKTFLRMEGRVVQWLSEGYQRRVLRAAVRQAYATFAEWHPKWATSLFDERFVMTRLLPVLESAIRDGVTVTPYQISLLWSQEVSQMPDRQIHHTAAILSAAKQFLALLSDAMVESNQWSEPAGTTPDTAKAPPVGTTEAHALV